MDYNKKANQTFLQLCDEIDELKELVEYWKEKYQVEKESNDKMSAQSLKDAKQGVANAFKFAMAISDNADGSLSISKEARKELSENYSK